MTIPLAGIVVAAYWNTRFTYAELMLQSAKPESVALAVKLDPWNATYRERLAKDLEDRTQDPDPELRAATRLDPLNSAWWIRRGIRAELAGDNSTAERFYLEAARVSQLFSPRVTLMNFYFRQDNPEAFLKWARLALEHSYGDLTGTFTLCWQVKPDADWIVQRVIPDDRGVLQQFLQFVTARAGAPAAAPVARRMLAHLDPAGRIALAGYCEALIASGNYPAAWEVWRKLEDARPAGELLSNTGFAHPSAQNGFDWRIIDTPEAGIVAGDPPGTLAVTFTGKQPETCDLVTQIVSLPAAANYRLSFEYRSEGSSDTGVSWRIEGPLPGNAQIAVAELPGAAEWTSRQLDFRAAGPHFVRAALQYRRAPGTVRFDGRITVRNLRLEGLTRGQ
jgi:hypothetical protein